VRVYVCVCVCERARVYMCGVKRTAQETLPVRTVKGKVIPLKARCGPEGG